MVVELRAIQPLDPTTKRIKKNKEIQKRMKIKSITALLAALPGLAFADLADFGAQSKPLDAGTASALEIVKDSGFIVTDVHDKSPAAALGLKHKDIVTHLNGKPLFTVTSLSHLIAGTCEAGKEIELSWQRGTEAMTGKILLDATATAGEFNERYPTTPAVAKKSAGLDLSKLTQSGGAATVIIGPGEDIPEDIKKLLASAGIDNLSNITGGAGCATGHPGVSAMKIYKIIDENGSTSVGPANDDNARKVTINDKSGKELFSEAITQEQIETKVPEMFRKTVEFGFTQDLDEPGADTDADTEKLLEKLKED